MKRSLLTIICLISIFTITTPVSASVIDDMIDVINSSRILPGAGGNPENPEIMVSRIIGYVLGFLGVIFLILMVAGGIIWMTAAGNEEKITKAKKILVSSASGLGIVLGAYLITYLVITILQGAAMG